jgi:hypothetical protein
MKIMVLIQFVVYALTTMNRLISFLLMFIIGMKIQTALLARMIVNIVMAALIEIAFMAMLKI